jgi:hypothetical protein
MSCPGNAVEAQAFLRRSAAAPFGCRWLCGRVAAWGDPRYIARALLADFPTRFAADPSVPAAQALARQLEP